MAEPMLTLPPWSEWQGNELDKVKCRFGCNEPIAGIYHVPEGCWCWRDPIQALCGQHYLKAQSTGPIRALIWRPLGGPSPMSDQPKRRTYTAEEFEQHAAELQEFLDEVYDEQEGSVHLLTIAALRIAAAVMRPGYLEAEMKRRGHLGARLWIGDVRCALTEPQP